MAIKFIKPRISRHRRIRSKLTGTAQRPRLAVYRSLLHINVQLIDDISGKTLAAASDVELKTKAKTNARELAKQVGKLIAEKAQAAGIKQIVFDRGGYAYHGRIQALADGAREAGLEF